MVRRNDGRNHSSTAVEMNTVLCPLRQGEIDLIKRALRSYMKEEQNSIQRAITEGPPAHADDVRRQVTSRLQAATALIERLIHDPEGKGVSRYGNSSYDPR